MRTTEAGLISTIIAALLACLLLLAANCGDGNPCDAGMVRYKQYDYMGLYKGSVCVPAGTAPERVAQ